MPDTSGSDGVAICYQWWAGPRPVILVHGFGSNAQTTWVDTGWAPTSQTVLCDAAMTFLPAADIVVITFGTGCLRNPDTKDLATGTVTHRTHWKAPASVKIAALTGGDDVAEDWSPRSRRFSAALKRG